MQKKLFLQLVGLFLITQAIGLFVGYFLIQGIIAGEIEQPGIVSDNPNDIWNAVALIAEILIATGFLLLALKILKKRISLGILLKIFESIVILFASLFVFSLFFAVIFGPYYLFPGFTIGDVLGIIAALAFFIARIVFKKNIWLRNASGILAAGFVGALLGIIFGIIPAIFFIVALSAYDYIAVFKTKHMVTLAKGIQGKNLAFTIAMPTPKHTFELGTGDFVVPLAFATSAMRDSFPLGFPNYFFIAILVLFGSILGLFLTLEYLSKRIGTALPALPVQTAMMLTMFLIGKLAGF